MRPRSETSISFLFWRALRHVVDARVGLEVIENDDTTRGARRRRIDVYMISVVVGIFAIALKSCAY